MAQLAERHLNPKAKAAVAELLEPGESLTDASTWADSQKRVIRGSAAWHYVNLPIDEDRYDARFARGNRSIVPKLLEFLNVLGDPDGPVEERRRVLRFVVHLVGDLHQPLHVGDNHDSGGNRTQVRFYARGTNKHRLWDSDLIERAGKTPDEWLAELVAMDTPEAHAAAAGKSIEDWATESLLAARQTYRGPATGQRIKAGAKLTDAYVEANRLVVRERLNQAGIRLATVLKEVWPEEKPMRMEGLVRSIPLP